MSFDRNEVFAIWDCLWRCDQVELLFLFRRGIGKTYLLPQRLKQTGIRALYWVAGCDYSQVQLRPFSQAAYNFVHLIVLPQTHIHMHLGSTRGR